MEQYADRATEIIDELHTERMDYDSEYLPLIYAANRLKANEDTGLEPEEVARLRELAEADKDGRCVVLPCKIGDTVYTVQEICFPCHKCEEMGRKEIEKCYELSTRPPFRAPYECPVAYEICENRAGGFAVSEQEDGVVDAGPAGEWGYEGLEPFFGRDLKQYYSLDDAVMVLKRLEAETTLKGAEK